LRRAPGSSKAGSASGPLLHPTILVNVRPSMRVGGRGSLRARGLRHAIHLARRGDR
jgi:hypothetical protein